MPRVLTVQRATVPTADRGKYLERLRTKAEYYRAANCRFWAFEEVALAGAFIEFTEADDPGTLAAAHAAAPDLVLDPARVYQQVEIT